MGDRIFCRENNGLNMKNTQNISTWANGQKINNQTEIKFGDLPNLIRDTINLFKPELEKFNIRFNLRKLNLRAQFTVTTKIDVVLLLIIQKFVSKRYSNKIVKIKFKFCLNKSTLEPEKLKIRFSSNLSQKQSRLIKDLPDIKKVKIKTVNKKNGTECFDAEFNISSVIIPEITAEKKLISYYPFSLNLNSSQKDQFIEQFKIHISSCKTIENINFDDLCSHFAMSRSTLYRRIKLSTGMSPSKFIKSHYLGMAASRLIDTNDPITDIAYEFGFNNSSYFSKSFKEHFSESPLQFRNKNKNRSFL